MQDAFDAAPFRQYAHKRTRGERLLTVHGRQQCNSSPLACGRYQNIETTCRKSRLDRNGAGVPVLCGQIPAAAALLFLVENRKFAKIRWRLRFTLLRQEHRTRYVCSRRSASFAGRHRYRGVREPGSPHRSLHARAGRGRRSCLTSRARKVTSAAPMIFMAVTARCASPTNAARGRSHQLLSKPARKTRSVPITISTARNRRVPGSIRSPIFGAIKGTANAARRQPPICIP
jgi:hypothetical protein